MFLWYFKGSLIDFTFIILVYADIPEMASTHTLAKARMTDWS